MSYIYITTNLVNGKKYIGQRCRSSVGDNYLGSGTKLKRAIKKHGRNSFIIEVITEGNYNKAFLDELERHYIRLYNANKSDDFYNITSGGTYLKSYIKPEGYAYLFNLNGKLIKTFYSLPEVSIGLNITKNSVIVALRNNSIVCNEFILSREKSYINVVPKSNSIRPIYHYDDKGLLIKVYKYGTRQVMKQLNLTAANISKLCITERFCYALNGYLSYNDKDIKLYKKYQSKQVLAFNIDENLIFSSITDCSLFFNVTHKTIKYRINNEQTINGYTLKYI